MLTIDVCVSHNAGSQASIWQMKLANCTLLRHLHAIGHVRGKKKISAPPFTSSIIRGSGWEETQRVAFIPK